MNVFNENKCTVEKKIYIINFMNDFFCIQQKLTEFLGKLGERYWFGISDFISLSPLYKCAEQRV